MIEILSWGTELELGDIGRSEIIPHTLGAWEYFECDIVNQQDPFWGIAADPKGIDPPMGGEINIYPSKTWAEQINNITAIEEFFKEKGYTPTTSCVSNTHIHVRIKNLHKDINLLKRFILAILINQKSFVEEVYHFQADSRMSNFAKQYLLEDSGMLNNDQQLKTMLYTKSIKEIFGLIKGDAQNIQDKSIRCAINLKPLLFMETIEFRCFRSTLNKEELSSCFKICEQFINTCRHNVKFEQILKENIYKFPHLNYDHQLFESWVATKKTPTFNTIKPRKLIEV